MFRLSRIRRRPPQPARGATVAILTADGFCLRELLDPCRALRAAGARTLVVAPRRQRIVPRGLLHADQAIRTDLALREADAVRFDALVLPGGAAAVDRLRAQPAALEFIRAFFAAGKPVAALGQGLSLVLETQRLAGRKLACPTSLRQDAGHAAAEVVERAMVADGALLTGTGERRSVPAFSRRVVRHLARLGAGRRR